MSTLDPLTPSEAAAFTEKSLPAVKLPTGRDSALVVPIPGDLLARFGKPYIARRLQMVLVRLDKLKTIL